MSLNLTPPEPKYLPSVLEAIAEYKSQPSPFEIHAVSKMISASENNFATYFQDVDNAAKGLNLKPRYVANTVFWLIDNEQYIGSINLRHTLTPNLEKVGGHIAYQIRPSQYHKGYAYAALLLCLNKAKKMGLDKILVTCEAENIASYSVMHKAMINYGGTEIEPVEVDGIIQKRVWLNTI